MREINRIRERRSGAIAGEYKSISILKRFAAAAIVTKKLQKHAIYRYIILRRGRSR